jgi:hypothetical protein
MQLSGSCRRDTNVQPLDQRQLDLRLLSHRGPESDLGDALYSEHREAYEASTPSLDLQRWMSACSHTLIYLDCYEAVTEREDHNGQYRLRRQRGF